MGAWFHLAQLNVARARTPLDDPALQPFRDAITSVNTLAEASDGFVWRLRDDVAYPGEPRVLVNLSVWQSIDALKAFTYRGQHVDVFRRRAEWFAPMTEAHMVLWWLPAGHQPTFEEARERLEHLRRHGPGPCGFTFAQPAAAPAEPPVPLSTAPLSYDGRRFQVAANTTNGDVAPGLVFHYRQQGARVWCHYGDGHAVRFGVLVAAVGADGALDMRYQHLDAAGELRTGRCHSRPSRLADGRLRLDETWQWTNGDGSAGESVLEELTS